MLSGQKTVAPIRLAVGRLAAKIGNRDIGRQIFVGAAQGIAEPRAGRWKTFRDVAGVHEDTAGAVGVGLRRHRMDEGDVVNMLGHVCEQ